MARYKIVAISTEDAYEDIKGFLIGKTGTFKNIKDTVPEGFVAADFYPDKPVELPDEEPQTEFFFFSVKIEEYNDKKEV